MNYKILVTGGAGYIGSVMVPKLLSLGNKVTVLDNFMYKQNSLLDCCHYDEFSIVKGDARDVSVVKPLLKNADIIIPLAAIVGAPACDRDKTATKSINIDAVKLIADNAGKNQIIILPNTNSGYGIGQKDKFCTEETPVKTISLYGTSKMEAEEIALDRGNSASLRLATVFGVSPRMRIDLMVNDFVYRAINDRFIVIFEGHFMRNFIHVRDVSKAFIHVIDNFEKMKNNAYNVGLSDANISKLELCEKIKKLLPDFAITEAPVGEDTDKRDYVVSNEKIEKTGFKPDFSLDMGIKELIKGYKIVKNSSFGNV